MSGKDLRKYERAACSLGEHGASSHGSPWTALLLTPHLCSTNAVLLFSHLKRRGTVVAGFEHHHSLKLFLTRSPGALSEPTCTPLADLGCVKVTSEGLCFHRHSGRQWLDHTHYVCVSVYWGQLVACVVDPISKAPDSQLPPRRAVRMARHS